MVRVIIKFPTDARSHGYRNRRLKIQEQAFDRNMYWRDRNRDELYHDYVGYAKNACAYLPMAPSCQHR